MLKYGGFDTIKSYFLECWSFELRSSLIDLTLELRLILFLLQTSRAFSDTSDKVTSILLFSLDITIPIHPDPEHKSITFFVPFKFLLFSRIHLTNSSVSGLGIKTPSFTKKS